MPKLRYAVLTAGGAWKEVAVDAPDDAAARRRLRRQGLIVVRVLGESTGEAGRFRLRRKSRFDIYAFTSRLAPLLVAGIPLEHGLAVLEEGSQEEGGFPGDTIYIGVYDIPETGEDSGEPARNVDYYLRGRELLEAYNRENPVAEIDGKEYEIQLVFSSQSSNLVFQRLRPQAAAQSLPPIPDLRSLSHSS